MCYVYMQTTINLCILCLCFFHGVYTIHHTTEPTDNTSFPHSDAWFAQAHVPKVNVIENAAYLKTHASQCCTTLYTTREYRESNHVSTCIKKPYYGMLYRPESIKKNSRPTTAYDCTISHKHKFIFPHIYKSGGSSLKNWFISVLCDGIAKKIGNRHPTANRACNRQILQHTHCGVLSNFPDYFSFAFVRHPVNRTISQYGMMSHPNFLNVPESQKPTLAEFVDNPNVAGKTSKLSKSHYRNQADFVLNRQRCPVVDFIGHLETYERDFYFILKKLDSDELWEGFKKYSFYGHRGNDPNVFGSNLKKEHKDKMLFTREMENIIYNRFPDDYNLFGYERVFP